MARLVVGRYIVCHVTHVLVERGEKHLMLYRPNAPAFKDPFTVPYVISSTSSSS